MLRHTRGARRSRKRFSSASGELPRCRLADCRASQSAEGAVLVLQPHESSTVGGASAHGRRPGLCVCDDCHATLLQILTQQYYSCTSRLHSCFATACGVATCRGRLCGRCLQRRYQRGATVCTVAEKSCKQGFAGPVRVILPCVIIQHSTEVRVACCLVP